MVGGYIYLDKEIQRAIVSSAFAASIGDPEQFVQLDGAYEYFQNIVSVGKPIYGDSVSYDTGVSIVRFPPFSVFPLADSSSVYFIIKIPPVGEFTFRIEIGNPNTIFIKKENT